ncbi:MAG: hypothetical protein ABJA81_08665 [Nocardioidaceae bacterium]
MADTRPRQPNAAIAPSTGGPLAAHGVAGYDPSEPSAIPASPRRLRWRRFEDVDRSRVPSVRTSHDPCASVHNKQIRTFRCVTLHGEHGKGGNGFIESRRV